MGRYEESKITIEMVRSSECDPSKMPASSIKTVAQEPGTQTEESGSQQNCPDPVTLLKDCLDMNNIL